MAYSRLYANVEGMVRWILLGIYILFAAGFGAFSLVCDFQYCEVVGVLIPTAPWLQVSGFLGIDFPTAVIPVFYLMNAGIAFVIGYIVDRLLV